MEVVNERSVDCDSDLYGAVYSVLDLHDNSVRKTEYDKLYLLLSALVRGSE